MSRSIYISISILDFSANFNPNLVILIPWIRIGVIFLNILDSLISNLNSSSELIEFQRYLENFHYFSVDSTLIHDYTLN